MRASSESERSSSGKAGSKAVIRNPPAPEGFFGKTDERIPNGQGLPHDGILLYLPVDRFFRNGEKVRGPRHSGFGILFPALEDLLVPVGSFQEECKILVA
jgi:hypothetical protein